MLFALMFYPSAGFTQNDNGKDFDSWAKEFRQSLSDQNNPAPSPAAGDNAPAATMPQQENQPAPEQAPRAKVASQPQDAPPAAAPAPKARPKPAAKPAKEDLVNVDMNSSPDVVGLDTGNVQSLERRITYLERDLRYMEDRLRSLERTVDDVRRRVR